MPEYYEDRSEFYQKYMENLHRKADMSYPDLEDRYCPMCGERLVRGSISYYEEFHIDSCD